MQWPSRDELQAHIERNSELFGRTVANAFFEDLLAIITFVAIGLTAVAMISAYQQRHACKPYHYGRDIDAATHDTTDWYDCVRSDGTTWRMNSPEAKEMRIK